MVVRRSKVIEMIEISNMRALAASEGVTEEWVQMGPYDSSIQTAFKVLSTAYDN